MRYEDQNRQLTDPIHTLLLPLGAQVAVRRPSHYTFDAYLSYVLLLVEHDALATVT